jgi:hypothetical protein
MVLGWFLTVADLGAEIGWWGRCSWLWDGFSWLRVWDLRFTSVLNITMRACE